MLKNFLKYCSSFLAIIFALIIRIFYLKSKQLEKDALIDQATIQNLNENIEIKNKASGASFSDKLDVLLSDQKNRSKK